MEAVIVWNRNLFRLREIINAVKFSFKLEDNFFLEAQNLFYQNFEKYYEKDDKYLKFFTFCLNPVNG